MQQAELQLYWVIVVAGLEKQSHYQVVLRFPEIGYFQGRLHEHDR